MKYSLKALYLICLLAVLGWPLAVKMGSTNDIRVNNPFLDRRVKMLPCQKEMVIWWFEHTKISVAGLSRLFKVNRRTIQFILFPDRLGDNVEQREKRGGWKQYYDKDGHAISVKEHREYKKLIIK